MMKLVRVGLACLLAAWWPVGAMAQFAAQQTFCSGACVGGTANAITLAIPNVTSLADLVGVPIRFIPSAANTAGATLAVGTAPAAAIKKPSLSSPVALTGGELPAGSTIECVYDGTEYIIIAGGFITGGPALSAPVSYYVSNSGSDSNNCLAVGTPCLTIQHVLTVVNGLNLNGYTVTINLADGVYAPITLPLINGSGKVVITGDAANPANTIIFNSTTGSAINVAATTGYLIQNVMLETTAANIGDPAVGVWVSGGNVGLNNVYYGTCSGGFVFAVSGYVALFGNIVISGSISGNSLAAGTAFLSTAGAVILVSPLKITITISTPVSIPFFVGAIQNGSTSIQYSTITGASNVTGTRYSAVLNGVISTGGGGANYYPGTIAGSTSFGGQYN